MPHILIVEDELSIAQSLEFVLQSEAFGTQHLTLAREGLNYVKTMPVDLVILDVGLPDMTGFEACKELRKFSDVPVMFLTARADEIDRIVGLEIGADDYVVKPFSPREVAARVKAILKRRPAPPLISTEAMAIAAPVMGDFSVDAHRVEIRYQGYVLPLTKVEFVIFQTLLSQPMRVFSRAQLLESLAGPQWENYERTIDTHIKTLRAKLRDAGADVNVIKTVRGFGYSAQI